MPQIQFLDRLLEHPVVPQRWARSHRHQVHVCSDIEKHIVVFVSSEPQPPALEAATEGGGEGGGPTFVRSSSSTGADMLFFVTEEKEKEGRRNFLQETCGSRVLSPGLLTGYHYASSFPSGACGMKDFQAFVAALEATSVSVCVIVGHWPVPSRIRVSAGSCMAFSVFQAVESQLVPTCGGFRVDLSGYTLMRRSTEFSHNFTHFSVKFDPRTFWTFLLDIISTCPL